MHWVDEVAQRLLQKGRKHVIASGTSISGQIHIGNAGDVIIADAVARSVREKGGEARIIWVADDVDPLRKIPEQLPKEFDTYLGMPVKDLPDPKTGTKEGFTGYFIRPFMSDLKELGVEPEIFSGREMYKNGIYEPLILEALKKGKDIRDLLERISGSKRSEDWLPFDPVCDKCGKLTPTEAFSLEYSGDKPVVRYRCQGGVAGKAKVEGCGHEGVADLRNGKLTWRVEWAARWRILGVTCEPFGKEHAAAGGSYDTSKVISKEIFGYDAPEPVIYEHIQVGGRKMSKSLGNVISLRDMLDVIPPEVVRFFYFRTKAGKHKDFDINKNLKQLVDTYEHVERLFFGAEQPSPQEDLETLKRSYVLSQTGGPPQKYFQIPYGHLITIYQIVGEDWDKAKAIMARQGQLAGMAEGGVEARTRHKYECAGRWLERFAPPEDKFILVKEHSQAPELAKSLAPEQRAFIKALDEKMGAVEWTAAKIHDAVHDTTVASGLKAAQGFEALYRILVNNTKGPRLGYFLAALEREWVLERLRAAASA